MVCGWQIPNLAMFPTYNCSPPPTTHVPTPFLPRPFLYIYTHTYISTSISICIYSPAHTSILHQIFLPCSFLLLRLHLQAAGYIQSSPDKQSISMCSSKSKLQQQQQQRRTNNGGPNRAPLLERCNSIPLIKSDFSPGNRILPLIDGQPASPLLHNSKSFKYSPGGIAAARREQVATLQGQRKLRIAHYGRTPKSKLLPPDINHNSPQGMKRRCTFITPNSDPVYVAYHDEEWGVPVHDDRLLFELLVLTGAQVGSDWTSVLRRRQDFRDAFAGFDVEIVSGFSEKRMISISAEYCIGLSLVRGVVDNSKRIIQVKRETGSTLDRYLWGFVNHKAMATQYKSCNRIPVKTSKSESISKDMVRRGFRQVGPTVIHSFMQAAGLTNDHLITCPRHSAAPAPAASD